MDHPITDILKRRAVSKNAGIYSACTAAPLVIKAVARTAAENGLVALIEATANQVNQFGGYTGMRPADYAGFVRSIAASEGLSDDMLVLGGDHLGPLTWKDRPESEAMDLAEALVTEYVLAGFTKIHIDTSMRLGDDDPSAPLAEEKIASRGARLALAAEKAYAELVKTKPDAMHPIYCIGSEVPIPGGEQGSDSVSVTRPEAFCATVDAFRAAFDKVGASDAWNYVRGVVVQPGVEFGDDTVHGYDRAAASELCNMLEQYPGLVFEGHSTDYQTKKALLHMVEDGIAILKVGPALTFAMREGLFALECIEKELCCGELSDFRATLERVMLQSPGNWKKYYYGTDAELAVKRAFSYSDRCRYYLPNAEVEAAMEKLFANIRGVKLPLSLLSQYMPMQYTAVREGRIKADPEALVMDRIGNCIDEYLFALESPEEVPLF